MAAKAAGVHRDTVYEERRRNPAFAAALEKADHDVGDLLETRAIEEALGGNDRLLALLLKARRPERYGDKLRQDQIEQIRREAKDAVVSELEEAITRLPDGAQKLLFTALDQVTKNELTIPIRRTPGV